MINDWVKRLDSFRNAVTGLAVYGRDKRMATEIDGARELSEVQLSALYDGNDLAHQLVAKPIQAEFRNWVDFTGLDPEVNEAMINYVRKVQLRPRFKAARTWEDIFGGGVLYFTFNDGARSESEPLNESAIKSIIKIQAVSRYRCTIKERDPISKEPTMFTIASIDVHASRCIFFPGPECTPITRDKNGGWGNSVYTQTYQTLADTAAAFGSISSIIQTFVQRIIRIPGVQAAMMAGKEDILRRRVSLIDEAMSIINAVVLGDGEEYETKTASVQGMPDLVDRQMMMLCASGNIPMTVLFGRSPAGLNATGESDVKLWEDRITDQREERTRPRLHRAFEFCFLAKDGPTGGKMPDGWSFKFNPLSSPSMKELAEIHLTQSQADANYIDKQVLSEETVQLSRFGSGEYSLETTLQETDEDLNELVEAAREAAMSEGDSTGEP